MVAIAKLWSQIKYFLCFFSLNLSALYITVSFEMWSKTTQNSENYFFLEARGKGKPFENWIESEFSEIFS